MDTWYVGKDGEEISFCKQSIYCSKDDRVLQAGAGGKSSMIRNVSGIIVPY